MKAIKPGSKKTTAAVKTPAAKTPAAAVKPVAKAVKAPAAQATTPHHEITSEQIAARAYSLWEQHGRPHGRDFELWLQAENQLTQASQSLAA